MKEQLAKLFCRFVAGVKSAQFEQVVDWVVEAGEDPRFETGLDQATRVLEQYNANFAQRAEWVVRTVIQICYFIARLRGLNT